MRKIRARVLKYLEAAKLTNKELSFFLHICQYQDESGNVPGIYYKDICSALNMSVQTFYNSLYRLRDLGLLKIKKANKIDWDIQVVGNDCRDIDLVTKEGYLSVADGMFSQEKFWKLKANEKLMAMKLLVFCRSGKRTYQEEKSGFLSKMAGLLSCGERAVRKYLVSLKQLFSIGIKNGKYLVSIRREVKDREYGFDAETDAQLENRQKVRAACNRNRIAAERKGMDDTGRLAQQYKEDIQELKERHWMPSDDLFGWLIEKAREGLRGRLNAKYIHVILRNEIQQFNKAKDAGRLPM